MALYDVLDAEQHVVNRIMLDDSSAWTPPQGHTIRKTTGGPFGGLPPLITIPIDANTVNAERDRRIAAGFVFKGVLYQCRRDDRINISGTGILASFAIAAGARSGDLRWHGGDTDFVWIAMDNSLVTMDAQTVVAFGRAAATWISAHVFAARTIKDMSPIPADYADDAYWPSND